MFGERHYVSVLLAMMGSWGFLVSSAGWITNIPSAPLSVKLIYVVVSATLPFVLWFDKDNRIILLCVKLFDRRNFGKLGDPIQGTWDIHISFPDEDSGDNEQKKRYGHLDLVKTALGHRIEGAQLNDANDNKTMARWSANRVAFAKFSGTNLLMYAYEIFEHDGGMRKTPDKVGLVVAGQVGQETEFRGVFHDFELTPDQTLRSGIVHLKKP